MNLENCSIAILDNILMYKNNLEISKELSKQNFDVVYVGSELCDLLALDLKSLKILIIGNLGSKEYMESIYNNMNISSKFENTKIVYILANSEIDQLSKFSNENIFGLITYDDHDDLVKILSIVNHGRKYISNSIHQPILDFLFSKRSPKTNVKEIYLNDKAIDVLEQLAKGFSYSEIGEKLYLSIDSIRYHIKEIYAAFGVNNKGSVIGMYLRNEIKISTALKRKSNKKFNQIHYLSN